MGLSINLWIRNLRFSKNVLRKGKVLQLDKEDDLVILNSKLKLDGFNSLSQLVRAWIKGVYPSNGNNEQVEKLIQRIRDTGIKDPLIGEFSPTFYRNVNLEDMLKDLSKDLSKLYAYPKHAEDF